MIVSWDWLQEYVPLGLSPQDLTRRLAMAGLNLEDLSAVGDDLAIDLEVTSNRPDCLGHLGVAREIAVLLGVALRLPAAAPASCATPVAEVTRVTLDCPDLCPHYSARVIRGIKVGPSPAWLVRRLTTVGVKAINNVVDATNYVMLECGQPLHAFDFARLRGRQIVVREGRAGEQIVAIDHKTYAVEPGMCMIADAQRPVAIAGVMGGYDTEVGSGTTELLLESAEFQPLAVRNAARKLRLRSPSSDRFERGVDPEGVDWASRRCCELILELAGGTLLTGSCDEAVERAPRAPVVLRFSQLPRILGVSVPTDAVRRILTALGCREQRVTPESVTTLPPSWRRDLTREIDLVEEVARIHGYDRIPEDVGVPMFPSHRTDADRVLHKVRQALTAAGFDEALTISAVGDDLARTFSPWTEAPALCCQTPIIKGADQLRRSLVPSLLAARATNESLSNAVIELFEIARVYLPRPTGLPAEPLVLGMTSGREFFAVKGSIEAVLDVLHIAATLEVEEYAHEFLEAGTGCRLRLGSELFGFLGRTSAMANQLFGLRQSSTVAELDLDVLGRQAMLVPRYSPLALYPAIVQDLNFVVAESLRWADLAATVRSSGGELLEGVAYRETYRNPQTDGPGRKRLLLSLTLRSRTATLTTEQANALRERIVAAVARAHDGRLIG